MPCPLNVMIARKTTLIIRACIMKRLINPRYFQVLLLWIVLMFAAAETRAQTHGGAQEVDYKVGFLGVPCHPEVDWSAANLQRMKDLGFNVLQLNIAWGYRPNDEALNLEDVVDLPTELSRTAGDKSREQMRTPQRIGIRSEKLRQRIEISRKFGFRTMFHFGAPNVFYPPESPGAPGVILDQCISDEATLSRYIALLRAFHAKFPGVDDLLCYTYDQNAWLCNEAGACHKCHGVPLPGRVSKFINTLARTWRELNPAGTLFWEPWELSAGQTYQCVDLLDPSCVGLSLHSNIAEVQIAFPADRWFKNMLTKAAERKIPVLGELWTGSPTEEMEPFLHIATPLATLRALRAVNEAGKLKGIKEYYGNVPDQEDPNLRMTGLFFKNPNMGDEEALAQLAKPYADAAQGVAKVWRLTSEAVEMYPWDASWLAREVGRSSPKHALSGAILKGASWQTPSWQANRRVNFMRTDETAAPNFWMCEDIQMRFEQTAGKLDAGLQAAGAVQSKVPERYQATFAKSIEEMKAFRVRVLAYAYHLRETNLVNLIRGAAQQGLGLNKENIRELREVMVKDQQNMGSREPIGTAIRLLDADPGKFLSTYFLPWTKSDKNQDWADWGGAANWTITSPNEFFEKKNDEKND
jgi:hypothetical protein